jgi:hypothetical protein
MDTFARLDNGGRKANTEFGITAFAKAAEAADSAFPGPFVTPDKSLLTPVSISSRRLAFFFVATLRLTAVLRFAAFFFAPIGPPG